MVWVKINKDDRESIWIDMPPKQTKKEKQEEMKRFIKAMEKINWDRVFKKKY